MLIICDSSPIIALAVCDKLNLLDELYGEVAVPQKVYTEVIKPGKPQSEKLRLWAGSKVVSVSSQFVQQAERLKLDPGETEAIALYWERNADDLLVDDLQARNAALEEKINIVGSSGILLRAKAEGLISSVRPYLDMIYNSDVYISKALYDMVLKLAGEE
jgi:predicted nucleic acid-binding protein